MAVKAWRMELAGQIILNGDWMKCSPYFLPPRAEEIRSISVPPTSVTFLGAAIGGQFLASLDIPRRIACRSKTIPFNDIDRWVL